MKTVIEYIVGASILSLIIMVSAGLAWAICKVVPPPFPFAAALAVFFLWCFRK